MIGHSWRNGTLLLALLLLACAQESPVANNNGDGGNDGGAGTPLLKPATFNASVNPTLPAGYSLAGEMPYRWQAYVLYDGAWVEAGYSTVTAGPSAVLVIDCNDPALHDACTVHRSAMIQVTVAGVTPGPALLCAYKSGFQFRADFLLNTPVGSLSVAPDAESSLDPLNQGFCIP